MNVCIHNHGVRWIRYFDDTWNLSDANMSYGADARVVQQHSDVYSLHYKFIEHCGWESPETTFPTLDAAMGYFAGLLAIRKLKE